MNFWAMGILGLVLGAIGGLYNIDTLTLIIIFLAFVIGYEIGEKRKNEGRKKK